MRLTRRGWAVVVSAVVGYVVGEAAGYAWFRSLAGVAFAVVVVAIAATMRLPRVEVSRTVHPDRIERGRPALATLVVRNPTAGGQHGCAAGDRVGDTEHRVHVRPLAPGAEAVYHYELPTHTRGLLQVGPLVLNRLDPFGLARSGVTTGGTTTLWVYPRRHAVRAPVAGHPRHHHVGPITDPPLRGSADLRAVREYVVGDEVRYLHWKATARTGQLMIREYADPAQPRFTVVLDNRPTAMTPTMFEEAVEVAASLLVAAATAGQHCGLVTPSGTDTPVGGGMRAAKLLLDELCQVGQDAAGDVGLVPRPLAATRPGGSLVVITGTGVDLGPARAWQPDTVIRLGAPGNHTGDSITAVDALGALARWNALRAGG
ncbi:FIG002343: hypothetical protein [Alloactinosynnema sp. L-07]|uniref:DUF58 domain-containing protein n=1 Tax=Alloactinosynnema sp. L-07 TaxID=1653480 RepID=UPI00065EEFCD|nr:DUF58 domain-containing protein [Alloactinosynnema sp. L-07]CRK58773.1 FIG002343: hypothetical protein [Alloactinosynnema sp. L-07]